MKNNIVEFRQDPMVEIEQLKPLGEKILYLNEAGMNELKSYSTITSNSFIPKEFRENFLGRNQESMFFLRTTAGIDEENIEYPEAYFAIENTQDEYFPYKILGLYSLGDCYLTPAEGEKVYLKMIKGKMMVRR